MNTFNLGVIGAGNMGAALLGGIKSRFPSVEIRVADPSEERRRLVAKQFSVETSDDNASICEFADIVLLCVKPQSVDHVLGTLQPKFSAAKLLVSVCAGVTCSRIESALGAGSRVVRAMPNTPALVGAGATAIAPGRDATKDDVALAKGVFDSVGTCVQVSEGLIDAVTGLSGSGPAYVLMALEALTAGGVEVGLPRDVAHALALQTLLGTAQLVQITGEHPAVLKDRVTSPGGTTIAGIRALERAGFRHALIDAVHAATARAVELGRAADALPKRIK
jgi:pyrroline-5-carboxylate reductase